MEARKYILSNKIEEDGKEYLTTKYEVKNVKISKKDWDWIYEYIMSDDWETAQSNGFYESENGYYSIDCQMVAERFDEYLEEMEEEYDETLEDKTDDFINDFKRIQKILEDNLDFTIYYETEK